MDLDVESKITKGLLQFHRVRRRAFPFVEAGHLEFLLIEDHALAPIFVIHVIEIRILEYWHERGNGLVHAEIKKKSIERFFNRTLLKKF